MSQPYARCRITIRGSFNLDWADYVGDMLVQVQKEEGNVCITTLIGRPIDLTAFLGTLNLLIDRGFAVIAFDYQEDSRLESTPGNSLPEQAARA
jgi:hypothetical protein